MLKFLPILLMLAYGLAMYRFSVWRTLRTLDARSRILDEPQITALTARMAQALFDWSLRNAQRTTVSEARAKAMRGRSQRKGILVGVWDEKELPPDLWSSYRGDAGA